MNRPNYTGLNSGLVGYWSFDGKDITGVTTYDRSGQGNNGTLTNGPVRTLGKLGQALKFDGVDDVVQTAATTLLGKYSISFWYRNTVSPSTVGAEVLMDQPFAWDSILDQGVSFSWDHNNSTFVQAWAVYDGAYTALKYTTSLSAKTWYHLVLTYDGVTARAYLDGIMEVSSAESPPTDSGTELIVMGSGATDGKFDDGTVDEVRIYNRALTADEVKRLYNLGR